MAEIEDGSITRVFVSGIPPSFTSDQLRDHFAQTFTVTDAHIVGDRRIGFVGFPDHEAARKAVNYFNRSFIRMSKLSVELARPVEYKREQTGLNVPVSKRRETHRERARASDTDEQQQRQNKRKRCISDDGEYLRQQQDGQVVQDDQFEHSISNSKTPTTELMVNNQEAQRPEKESGEPVGSESAKKPDLDTESGEHQASTQLPSDSDWLRGKTSRLLDLTDPQEALTTSAIVKNNPTIGPSRKSEVLPTPHDGSAIQDEKSSEQEQQLRVPNGRLFIRNLPYSVLEDDLRTMFSSFGKVSEIHLVKDSRTGNRKGLAFVQFSDSEHAEKALENLDGKDFQGRLIHVLPASDKKDQRLNDFEISKLPLKKQRAIKRKSEALTSSFSWNSLYMNPDAVLASVADRLGVSKSDILDASSTDAAVKQAHAETSVIKETKDYLRSKGVSVESFKARARDDRTILLKNFPYGTSVEELTSMLSTYGSIQQIIFPPTGTMAVIEFDEPYSATQAMKGMSYRNVNGSVLYIERAPQGIFSGTRTGEASSKTPQEAVAESGSSVEATSATTSTVFIRDLNFATTSSRLADVFKPLSGFLSARVKTRTDAARPGEVLSMGFGFAEFRSKSQAAAAVATMNGHLLDGHKILVQQSHKVVDAAEERRLDDNSKKADLEKTKIIIKNLPFEASKKDVRSLFKVYGQLRSVRMPKKFDSSGRGFAFADFVTSKEARNAMEALSNTHLLGRRLVLDFAEGESADPEDEIRAMEKKAGRQVHLTNVNKMMTGSARKKFNVDAREDIEPV